MTSTQERMEAWERIQEGAVIHRITLHFDHPFRFALVASLVVALLIGIAAFLEVPGAILKATTAGSILIATCIYWRWRSGPFSMILSAGVDSFRRQYGSIKALGSGLATALLWGLLVWWNVIVTYPFAPVPCPWCRPHMLPWSPYARHLVTLNDYLGAMVLGGFLTLCMSMVLVLMVGYFIVGWQNLWKRPYELLEEERS